MKRVVLALACSVALGYLTGCGNPVQSEANQSSAQDRVLHWDSTTRTVYFKLIAADGDVNGGMNFNGFANGGFTLTVPLGWRVDISFTNDSFMPHSAMVVPYAEHDSDAFDNSMVAFPGAETPNPVVGSSKGSQQTFSFTASQTGTYAVVCAVPGHAMAGMWDTLVVSSSASKPSYSIHP